MVNPAQRDAVPAVMRGMREATQMAGDAACRMGVGIVLAAKMLGLWAAASGDGAGADVGRSCDQGRRYGFRHYFYGGSEWGRRRSWRGGWWELYPGMQVAGGGNARRIGS